MRASTDVTPSSWRSCSGWAARGSRVAAALLQYLDGTAMKPGLHLIGHFDTWFKVTAIDAAIKTGTVNASDLFDGLGMAIGSALGAYHAVLVSPNAGDCAGKTFLVIDCNGMAGYQGWDDLTIQLNAATNLSKLSVATFT